DRFLEFALPPLPDRFPACSLRCASRPSARGESSIHRGTQSSLPVQGGCRHPAPPRTSAARPAPTRNTKLSLRRRCTEYPESRTLPCSPELCPQQASPVHSPLRQ